MNYNEWIEDFLAKNNNAVRGLCNYASEMMILNFPELKLERGYLVDKKGHYHQHWWCVAPDGSVVDPTVSQFESVAFYEAYDEEKHGPLPIGKCHDCGSYCYPGDYSSSFCTEECEKVYIAYLESERYL